MEKGASRPLEAGPEIPEPEVRKPVTVLFADLVDSTRMSRQLDPEALRHLLLTYFEQMQAVIERHGGLVEKFIGDAVMAVFGVPLVREDDALRAVRAAVEMRETLATLNQDLEQTLGVRLSTRVGINSGEVVAGQHQHGQLMVTGEVVNLAKRLEEAAATSEILISEATHRLVRDAVVAERVSDRPVKHGETVDALRVAEVLALAPGRARRLDSPLVGREHQLSALRSVFASARQNRACHLLTVLGPAGIGKSRLVQEFVSEIGAEATVPERPLPALRGGHHLLAVDRGCAGDPQHADRAGRGVLEHRDRRVAPGEEKAELIAELILEALGLGSTGAGTGEATSWAVRKLFEAIAQRRPLVVVFDDLQWAEPTFVDLVELPCGALARRTDPRWSAWRGSELLDNYPDWARRQAQRDVVAAGAPERRRLPQADREPARRADSSRPRRRRRSPRRPTATRCSPRSCWRCWSTTSSSPGTASAGSRRAPARRCGCRRRSTRCSPHASRACPATSARSSCWHPSRERSSIAARSASSLPRLPDAFLERSLAALVRRDVIRPDRANFAGDEAYRFRHLLIRDAAYNSLPRPSGPLITSAWRPGSSAWPPTASASTRRSSAITSSRRIAVASSSARAEPRRGSSAHGPSQRLELAGRRALARSDLPAAIGLLERAASLSADDMSRRAELLPELGAALIEAGRLPEADWVLGEARLVAARTGDERADSRVLVQLQFLRLLHVTEGGAEEAARAVERVIPIFERCDDQQGLCSARRLEAWLHWNEARATAAAKAWERAAAHAGRAADEHARAEILTWIASSLWFGPTPVVEAIGRCEEIRGEVSGHLESEALTVRHLPGCTR